MEGSGTGHLHVAVQAAPDEAPWDAWGHDQEGEPVGHAQPRALRKTILRERDDARRDPSQRPAFRAYRLNQLVEVYRDVLVEADAWRAVEARPVPARHGRPIVGLDLGAERSWSAAWALWTNGRSECYAVCPGVPDHRHPRATGRRGPRSLSTPA